MHNTSIVQALFQPSITVKTPIKPSYFYISFHQKSSLRFPFSKHRMTSNNKWHQPDEKLLEPWKYILNVPGKNVRGKMIAAFNKWLTVDPTKVKEITTVVAMLHTSSLLIDDIEDDSTLRRGVPVAHAIYGLPSTLNTANYVYVLALQKCMRLNSADATHVFTQELLNLHRGQGQDILWRDTCTCPTEEQYRSMVLDKTGGLFRLAVGLLQSFSTNKTNYCPLLNSMAYYFQVRDDYMNIASTEYFANKSFCEDLTEGKFSFPVIHCIRTQPEDNRLLRILKQKTRDVTVKKHAVEWMIKCGSLEYTRAKLNDLYKECIDTIEGLGGHTALQALLQTLHEQIEDVSSATSASDAMAHSSSCTPPSSVISRKKSSSPNTSSIAASSSPSSSLIDSKESPLNNNNNNNNNNEQEEFSTTRTIGSESPLRSGSTGSFDTL